jgi:hypothetical protein
VVNARCVHCLLSLFNSSDKPVNFQLPTGWYWVALLDTAAGDGLPMARYVELEKTTVVEEKAMIVLYGLSSQCDWQADPLLVDHPESGQGD